MARLKDGRKWRGFILSRGSKHFLAIKLIILLNLYYKWLMLPEMKCPSISSLSHLFRYKNIFWQIALQTEVLHFTLNLSEIWHWIYLKFDTEFIWNLIWNFSLLRSLNVNKFSKCMSERFPLPTFQSGENMDHTTSPFEYELR